MQYLCKKNCLVYAAQTLHSTAQWLEIKKTGKKFAISKFRLRHYPLSEEPC